MEGEPGQGSVQNPQHPIGKSGNDLVQELIPWWGKLIHRKVTAEMQRKIEDEKGGNNDIKDNVITSTTAGLHIHQTVNTNAGV